MSTLKKQPAAFLKPRALNLDFGDDIPKYYFQDNPVLSAYFAAMSCSFPDGERFFIHSVRHFESQIKDPELKKEVKGFIGQEAHHGRLHEDFNAWLEKQGISALALEARNKRDLEKLKARLPKKVQLAVTTGLEHFTAIMAEVVLNDGVFKKSHPTIQKLGHWHALEETEHKAVAFDIYQEQVGDLRLRRVSMALLSVFFILSMLYFQIKFLIEWKQLWNFKAWGQATWFMWGTPGWFRKIVIPYLKYYKKDFHPWDDHNQELMDKWQAEVDAYLVAE